ncbi:MAG TPA: TetR family transcriptional regulator [Paraburkholderia sp.]
MKNPIKATTHDQTELPAVTRRKYDAEQTRQNILDVATGEFSMMGLAGARVDAIAERTQAAKRMIYYYFGSKEGLYKAVLEKVYGDIRELEKQLHVEEMAPLDGLTRLVEFTFDYHDRHRHFVRLASIENIHQASYAERLPDFKSRNASVIHTIEKLLAAGVTSKVFRSDIDAIDLHWMISSLCFHRVSNRYTFRAAFGRDMGQARVRNRQKQMVVDTVLRFVTR